MKLKTISTLAAAALLTGSLSVVQAEKVKKPAAKPAKAKAAKKSDRPSREAIVKRFDKDGDGKLNETERKAAGAALRKQSGRQSDRASESDRRRQRIETATKQIRAAVKAGEITEEQGKERMAALRKRISQGQSRSGESDRVRQRIETARKQISAAMKAGEITEEQGKERMAALRKRISQSQSRSGNSRANSDNDRSSRGGDYRARLMKEYDKNGDGKLDEAEREAARKAFSSRRNRGGAERGERSRGRDSDRATDRRRRGGNGEATERRRRGGDRRKKN